MFGDDTARMLAAVDYLRSGVDLRGGRDPLNVEPDDSPHVALM
jgi:hypothetical protein